MNRNRIYSRVDALPTLAWATFVLLTAYLCIVTVAGLTLTFILVMRAILEAVLG